MVRRESELWTGREGGGEVRVSPGNCTALGSPHTPRDPRGCMALWLFLNFTSIFSPSRIRWKKAMHFSEEFLVKRYI